MVINYNCLHSIFFNYNWIGVFAQGQILCISPNGLQPGHCDAPPPHFGWPKMNFDRISRNFREIRKFQRNTQISEKYAKILDDRSHFSPFQINTEFLLFCSKNGCRRPFWMIENYFRSHFLPFQINTQLYFFLTKWLPATILDDRKSLSIAFLGISD